MKVADPSPPVGYDPTKSGPYNATNAKAGQEAGYAAANASREAAELRKPILADFQAITGREYPGAPVTKHDMATIWMSRPGEPSYLKNFSIFLEVMTNSKNDAALHGHHWSPQSSVSDTVSAVTKAALQKLQSDDLQDLFLPMVMEFADGKSDISAPKALVDMALQLIKQANPGLTEAYGEAKLRYDVERSLVDIAKTTCTEAKQMMTQYQDQMAVPVSGKSPSDHGTHTPPAPPAHRPPAQGSHP